MRSVIILSALATAVMGANSTDSTYTLPAGFNIGLVESSERSNWCFAQRNTCPDICETGTKLNSCDASTLQFTCVCSDGSIPDVTPYKQTVPFYVCQAAYGQCINSHPNDAEGQRACKKAAVCGSKNASETTTTASSTMSSTTLAMATATESSSSETSSVAPASTTTNAAVALGDLSQYSTGLMAGLMFLAARMVL
ncbi:hypothetical protein N7491_008981 [Penicillium cf. griseofulvum]|uniref:DUF7707 domain-containing protein n=1 Tax=Penicillium cf. griseofulvum TaxID=2972120 RepID=A0A9W9JNN9_9EURO|nr:hypothetical protein N7472_005423 [Penicillium cf. griseofulvum]KAJ5423765.1 hypothetical protein N7491_008981 [Penicillium cf. griseofulvum]KAJ5430982.1 hypothetical protein N7445_008714 [Penicillium cf. griseofulvum]